MSNNFQDLVDAMATMHRRADVPKMGAHGWLNEITERSEKLRALTIFRGKPISEDLARQALAEIATAAELAAEDLGLVPTTKRRRDDPSAGQVSPKRRGSRHAATDEKRAAEGRTILENRTHES